MTAHEWAHEINEHICHLMTLDGICKVDENPCPHWQDGQSCDNFIRRGDAVRRSSVDQKLRELIEESGGEMLFVEYDDNRFSQDDLERMMNCIVLEHPILSDYVKIDTTGKGDALITIFEGASSILV